ncbi:SRP54-type protein [Entophlyctis helioformis]|nr:SRP54-type protein [Entophlyctis helioformis]
MIDLATIVTRGGVVLWSREFVSLPTGKTGPVDAVIRNVLIEERAGLDAYTVDSMLVKWTFANDLGLVFVVAHQKVLALGYIDDLLGGIKSTFCGRFKDELASGDVVSHLDAFSDYNPVFDAVLDAVEESARDTKKHKAPRSFKETRKYASTLEGSQQSPAQQRKDASAAGGADAARKNDGSAAAGSAAGSDSESLAAKLEKLARKGVGPRKGSAAKRVAPAKAAAGSVDGASAPASGASSPQPKKGKQMRAWDASGNAVMGSASQKLDFSTGTEDDAAVSADLIGDGLGTRGADGSYDALELDYPEDDDMDDEPDEDADAKQKPKSSGLFSYFERWTAGKTLSEQDLEPAMAKMKEHLVNKNVAADIANHLCQSVASGLVGQKIGPFKSLNAAIKEQMEIALQRILTPSSSTDVLRDVNVANRAGRPYTFVFVGVNGVGKSTNLSKICFWLLQNKKKVLIAACDTFRSGAVEQLRVHARNLKALEEGAVVDLFDRGYGKDPAGIAKDAIHYASTEKYYDVVLIDTAGRMQDNEPLMRALAKLIAVNNPDKILFVGEALVGNEAVDQLSKFNQSLRDFSGLRDPRQIDGMILTKFDTIDDKVGAALSMTYTTGKPILFVGTGQTYTDLRKMNVRSIVAALLK